MKRYYIVAMIGIVQVSSASASWTGKEVPELRAPNTSPAEGSLEFPRGDSVPTQRPVSAWTQRYGMIKQQRKAEEICQQAVVGKQLSLPVGQQLSPRGAQRRGGTVVLPAEEESNKAKQ